MDFLRRGLLLGLWGVLALASFGAQGQTSKSPLSTGAPSTWSDFSHQVQREIRRDESEGWGYIVSGGFSLVGGLVGTALSRDPAEGLVFTLFQNIGVASIGFGYLKLETGDERRSFYVTILSTPGLSELDRDALVRSYALQRAEIERKTRIMRAITTGLLGAVNIYGGAREKDSRLRNGLYVLGVVNLLACASFSLDF